MARDVQNGRLPASIFAEVEAEQGDYIGQDVRSIDAPSKVTGRLKYAGDMIRPGMLHVQVLRSPHAHARIVSIDTSAAKQWKASKASSQVPMYQERTVSACSSTIN
jgi:xanthine dehydrogenase molybdopterin-binding subunit B